MVISRRPPCPDNWRDKLPEWIAFIDTETTGFGQYDRMLSLAVITLRLPYPPDDVGEMRYGYWIFDPGRKSHPRALAVHGFDDWTLRHQDKFSSKNSEEINKLLNLSGLIVGHNVSFDVNFLSYSYKESKSTLKIPEQYCTSEAFRRHFPGLPAKLTSVCEYLGLSQQSTIHGALEDAWLCMNVFLTLNTPLDPIQMPQEAKKPPSNMREVPPRPDGELPPRKRGRRRSSAKPPANGQAEPVRPEGAPSPQAAAPPCDVIRSPAPTECWPERNFPPDLPAKAPNDWTAIAGDAAAVSNDNDNGVEKVCARSNNAEIERVKSATRPKDRNAPAAPASREQTSPPVSIHKPPELSGVVIKKKSALISNIAICNILVAAILIVGLTLVLVGLGNSPNHNSTTDNGISAPIARNSPPPRLRKSPHPRNPPHR